MNELRTVAQSVAVASAAHHPATRAITSKDKRNTPAGVARLTGPIPCPLCWHEDSDAHLLDGLLPRLSQCGRSDRANLDRHCIRHSLAAITRWSASGCARSDADADMRRSGTARRCLERNWRISICGRSARRLFDRRRAAGFQIRGENGGGEAGCGRKPGSPTRHRGSSRRSHCCRQARTPSIAAQSALVSIGSPRA